MANQPLGFQQESLHSSFWKTTGDLNFPFNAQGGGGDYGIP
jgi:hypothetical protein